MCHPQDANSVWLPSILKSRSIINDSAAMGVNMVQTYATSDWMSFWRCSDLNHRAKPMMKCCS